MFGTTHYLATATLEIIEVKNVAMCCQESSCDALNLDDLAEWLGWWKDVFSAPGKPWRDVQSLDLHINGYIGVMKRIVFKYRIWWDSCMIQIYSLRFGWFFPMGEGAGINIPWISMGILWEVFSGVGFDGLKLSRSDAFPFICWMMPFCFGQLVGFWWEILRQDCTKVSNLDA